MRRTPLKRTQVQYVQRLFNEDEAREYLRGECAVPEGEVDVIVLEIQNQMMRILMGGKS